MNLEKANSFSYYVCIPSFRRDFAFPSYCKTKTDVCFHSHTARRRESSCRISLQEAACSLDPAHATDLRGAFVLSRCSRSKIVVYVHSHTVLRRALFYATYLQLRIPPRVTYMSQISKLCIHRWAVANRNLLFVLNLIYYVARHCSVLLDAKRYKNSFVLWVSQI